jgi:hypothetical protein
MLVVGSAQPKFRSQSEANTCSGFDEIRVRLLNARWISCKMIRALLKLPSDVANPQCWGRVIQSQICLVSRHVREL